ncbi:MAG: acetolactate synthase small subunit, partial [Thioalkalivibrio sp.]|nr:acetolactate synthase small subunit [Thioalkalivibrio sp.]
DVVRLIDLTPHRHIEREMMLVKVKVTDNTGREEAKRLTDIFRGNVVDVSQETYVIELTGHGSKLDSFLEALQNFPVMEVVRSGVMGIARGDVALHL